MSNMKASLYKGHILCMNCGERRGKVLFECTDSALIKHFYLFLCFKCRTLACQRLGRKSLGLKPKKRKVYKQ